jgi:hypothetical protein
LFLLIPVPLLADPATPSPFSIGTPEVFTNIFEEDDFLLLMPYDIEQSPQESIAVSQQFIFRLMDTDGTTELSSSIPYAYNNSGYGLGIVSFYFAADDAPTWGNAYILRIDGSPVYYTTALSVNRTLAADEYSSESDQAAALAEYILTEATALEIDWGVKLYETSDNGSIVLTSTGQTYFTTTIPGLAQVCPSIMASSSSNPNWDTTPQGHSAADAWESQWDGTAVKTELEKWGNTWHVAWNAVSGAILFGVMLLCAGFSQLKWGNGDPGFIVGNVVFVIGTFAGFIYWAIVMVEMIILGFWIGYNIFWKQG